VPVCTKANIYTGFVAARSFSLHPIGVLIYLPLAMLLYLTFVRQPIPIRWTFRQAMLQTMAVLLLPILHIPLLTMVMPGFNSEWHSQSPLLGFWILLVCGVALMAASYHERIKPMPASPSASV